MAGGRRRPAAVRPRGRSVRGRSTSRHRRRRRARLRRTGCCGRRGLVRRHRAPRRENGDDQDGRRVLGDAAASRLDRGAGGRGRRGGSDRRHDRPERPAGRPAVRLPGCSSHLGRGRLRRPGVAASASGSLAGGAAVASTPGARDAASASAGACARRRPCRARSRRRASAGEPARSGEHVGAGRAGGDRERAVGATGGERERRGHGSERSGRLRSSGEPDAGRSRGRPPREFLSSDGCSPRGLARTDGGRPEGDRARSGAAAGRRPGRDRARRRRQLHDASRRRRSPDRRCLGGCAPPTGHRPEGGAQRTVVAAASGEAARGHAGDRPSPARASHARRRRVDGSAALAAAAGREGDPSRAVAACRASEDACPTAGDDGLGSPAAGSLRAPCRRAGATGRPLPRRRLLPLGSDRERGRRLRGRRRRGADLAPSSLVQAAGAGGHAEASPYHLRTCRAST